MRTLTMDDEWPDDERAGVDILIPKGHATIFLSNGSSMTFPDEAWPRGITTICEEQGLPPPQHKLPICQSDDDVIVMRGLRGVPCVPVVELSRAPFPTNFGLAAETAPRKKYTVQQINKLVEQIRSGQPPQLPDGVREKHYRDPALPNFYIRLLDTGVASWTVQWKKLSRQKKTKVGDVLVLDRPAAIKAARDLLAKIQLDQLDPHEAKRQRMRANKVTFETVAVPLFLEGKIRKGELRPKSVKGTSNNDVS